MFLVQPEVKFITRSNVQCGSVRSEQVRYKRKRNVP